MKIKEAHAIPRGLLAVVKMACSFACDLFEALTRVRPPTMQDESYRDEVIDLTLSRDAYSSTSSCRSRDRVLTLELAAGGPSSCTTAPRTCRSATLSSTRAAARLLVRAGAHPRVGAVHPLAPSWQSQAGRWSEHLGAFRRDRERELASAVLPNQTGSPREPHSNLTRTPLELKPHSNPTSRTTPLLEPH